MLLFLQTFVSLSILMSLQKLFTYMNTSEALEKKQKRNI